MEAANVVSTLEFKFKGKVVLKEHNFPDQKRELIAFFLTVSPPEKLKTRYIIHYPQIIKFSEKQLYNNNFIRQSAQSIASQRTMLAGLGCATIPLTKEKVFEQTAYWEGKNAKVLLAVMS